MIITLISLIYTILESLYNEHVAKERSDYSSESLLNIFGRMLIKKLSYPIGIFCLDTHQFYIPKITISANAIDFRKGAGWSNNE